MNQRKGVKVARLILVIVSPYSLSLSLSLSLPPQFLFNAQTSSDLEDWVETLSEFTRSGGPRVPIPPRKQHYLTDAANYSSSTLPTVTTINDHRGGNHNNHLYRKDADDDVASNYSDESRYTYQESIASGRRGRSRPASVAPNDNNQDNFSIYAATETMV